MALGNGDIYSVKLRRVKGKPVLFFQEAAETLAATTLRWGHWLSLLGDLGFTRANDRLWSTNSPRAFLTALVFYSIAQTFRKPGKLEELRYIVETLELLELRFWGNAIVRGYKASGRLGVYRPARSFKILYGLGR